MPRVCTAIVVAALAWPAIARAAPDLAETAHLVVEHTNQLRADNGLPATQRNGQLDAAAAEFAAFMARTGRYSHEADGRQPAQRARAHGYDYCMVAENIAYQYSSAGFATEELARGLFEDWADSPGHRHNMLNAGATETGVGLARSAASGRYYAVQMFGRPQRLQIGFRVANRSAQAVGYELGDERFRLEPNVTRTHTICRPGPLRFVLPGEAEPTTLQPADGASYRIEPAGAGLRVGRGG